MKRISTAAAQQSRFFSHARRILRSRIALETRMQLPWVSRLLNGLGHEVSAGASGYLAGWLLPSVALIEHGR
jgi:hypothetical protein